MFQLLKPNGLNIFIGDNDSNVIAIGLQLIGTLLKSGEFEVVEVPLSDADQSRHIPDLLAALNADPVSAERYHLLKDARDLTPKEIANAAKDIAGNQHILILYAAPRPLNTHYESEQWLRVASQTVKYLTNFAIVTAISWGPEGMPSPDLHNLPADRVWRMRTGPMLQARLTDINTGYEILLKGQVMQPFGFPLFKQVETHNV